MISVMTHFSRVLVSALNQLKIVEMKITDNIIIKLVLCLGLRAQTEASTFS